MAICVSSMLMASACEKSPMDITENTTMDPTVVIAEKAVDYDQNGVEERLYVRMLTGESKEESDPGPIGGTYLEGEFRLELVSSDGDLLHALDLNLSFGNQPLIFAINRQFDISFEDYNNDGYLDFSIGQYFSSNGSTYNLYSLMPEGIAVIHQDLYTADSRYSILYEKAGNTSFRNRYYDMEKGAYTETLFTWQGTKFVRTECEGCGMQDKLPTETSTETPNEPTTETNELTVHPDGYVILPPNHYYRGMKVLNDREEALSLFVDPDSRPFEARIDMLENKLVEYGRTEDEYSRWKRVSPNGEWTAVWDRTTFGIWGVSAATDEKIQWTTGEGDWSPVWLSDGSGFYYLYDTGKDMGDGAGPEHTLAYYDIATGEQTVLSFGKGFWGSINWLEPDHSLVAYNGFDDVFALKVVDLQAGTEKQLLDTSDFYYVDTDVHPTKPLVLISEHGGFTWYDSKGNEASQIPWPSDMDEFTRKNPAYAEGGDPYHNPYYDKAIGGGAVGPSQMSYSPDGQHLAYWLGAIGWSSDDKVPGARLVISRDDGTEPVYVTEQYMRVLSYDWSPDSERIFVTYQKEEATDRLYLKTIDLTKVVNR